MKEPQMIALKEESHQAKKGFMLQRRISLRYWIGWGGGYSASKKKS